MGKIVASVAPEARPQGAEEVRWEAWLWTGLTLVLAAWVFFPILVFHPDPELFALQEIWDTDQNYSYGYLIPPLALYFIWEKRERLIGLPAEGSSWGLLLMAAAFGMFVLGLLGGVYYLPRASGVLLLLGGVLFVGGRRWSRELLFPVLFLLLMIPLPKFIFIQVALPLQVFAAEAAERVLFAVGIPILRTGNVIHLAHTDLEVAEACSGLRSLFALVTTGVVFAYFFGRTALQRTVVVALSVPIAILVNAARVAGTGWLAHHYGLEVATGYYHTVEGFGMFAIAFLLMSGIGFAAVSLLPGPRGQAREAPA
jgi:exosortase